MYNGIKKLTAHNLKGPGFKDLILFFLGGLCGRDFLSTHRVYCLLSGKGRYQPQLTLGDWLLNCLVWPTSTKFYQLLPRVWRQLEQLDIHQKIKRLLSESRSNVQHKMNCYLGTSKVEPQHFMGPKSLYKGVSIFQLWVCHGSSLFALPFDQSLWLACSGLPGRRVPTCQTGRLVPPHHKTHYKEAVVHGSL